MVTGEFHRQGLAADLGAVVAARHEAEVAAGQWRNIAQVGAANGGADFSVAGVIDAHEARAFWRRRAVEGSIATREGGYGQHAEASNQSEAFSETARSCSESHGVPLFQFCARSGVSD